MPDVPSAGGAYLEPRPILTGSLVLERLGDDRFRLHLTRGKYGVAWSEEGTAREMLYYLAIYLGFAEPALPPGVESEPEPEPVSA